MREGWICPKCSRVYSPIVPSCNYCNDKSKKYQDTTDIVIDNNNSSVEDILSGAAFDMVGWKEVSDE